MAEGNPARAHPAATVVLLRDAASSCEVLLLRRNSQLAFHGGAWVFPGGRIDPGDFGPSSDDLVEAARRAAVREAAEEAGVLIAPDELHLISRWITPETLPKRFDTWFFVAPTSGDRVQVDGGEIHDHQWVTPGRALEAQGRGEIELPPPTFVTLLQLSRMGCVADALASYRARPMEEFVPRLRMAGGAAYTVYSGDVAYEGADVDAPGPRHRLCMVGTSWRYERDGV